EAGDSEVFRDTWEIYRNFLEGEMRALNSSGLLLGFARFSTLTDSVSMGIKKDVFSREDLYFYHRGLSEFPFSKIVEGSFGEEIDFNVATFEALKEHRNRTWEQMRGGRPAGVFPYLLQIAPAGWIDLNAASSIRWTHEEGVLPWRTLEFDGLRDV